MNGQVWMLQRIRSILGEDCGHIECLYKEDGETMEVTVGCRPTSFQKLQDLCEYDRRSIGGARVSGRGADISIGLVVNVPRWVHRIDSVSDLMWGDGCFGTVGRGKDGKWWWKTVHSYGAFDTEEEARRRLESELG